MIAPAVAGGLIAGGAGLLSSGKGKKGGGAGGAGAAARLQAQIASDLYESSQPLRQRLLSGTPAVAPQIAGLDAAQQQRLADLERFLSSGQISETIESAEGLGGTQQIDRALTPQEQTLFSAERDALQQIGTTTVPGQPARPGLLQGFLDTGQLPTALNVPFAASRDALEDQFGVARQNAISRAGVRGGQLRSALVGLESDRARAVGQLPLLDLPIRRDLFGQALQIASGSPVSAAGIAGQSGQLFESVANRSAQAQLASGEALGQAGALAAKLATKGRGGSAAASAFPVFGGDLF